MNKAAHAHYLDRIGDDCEMLLGPGAQILDIRDASWSAGVTLRVSYSIGGSVRLAEAGGDTIVAAHAALRRQLAADRLVHGFIALACDPGRSSR